MESKSYWPVTDLRETHARFRHACDQVVLLNNHIESAQTRFQRVVKNGHQPLRYVLRMKVHSFERVRDMFYAYAHDLATVMNQLQVRIQEEGVVDLQDVLVEIGVVTQ